MGEAKRRKESLGDQYGKEGNVTSWLPVTKVQARQFVKWSNITAWIGIGALIAGWVVIRFIGPGLGWWHVD